jgi:hypothetical protein
VQLPSFVFISVLDVKGAHSDIIPDESDHGTITQETKFAHSQFGRCGVANISLCWPDLDSSHNSSVIQLIAWSLHWLSYHFSIIIIIIISSSIIIDVFGHLTIDLKRE